MPRQRLWIFCIVVVRMCCKDRFPPLPPKIRRCAVPPTPPAPRKGQRAFGALDGRRKTLTRHIAQTHVTNSLHITQQIPRVHSNIEVLTWSTRHLSTWVYLLLDVETNPTCTRAACSGAHDYDNPADRGDLAATPCAHTFAASASGSDPPTTQSRSQNRHPATPGAARSARRKSARRPGAALGTLGETRLQLVHVAAWLECCNWDESESGSTAMRLLSWVSTFTLSG